MWGCVDPSRRSRFSLTLQVQVQFDEPFEGALNIPGQRERCGFQCSPSDVQVGCWGSQTEFLIARPSPARCALRSRFPAH